MCNTSQLSYVELISAKVFLVFLMQTGSVHNFTSSLAWKPPTVKLISQVSTNIHLLNRDTSYIHFYEFSQDYKLHKLVKHLSSLQVFLT